MTPTNSTARLVNTLERWDRLALVLVQSVAVDGTVGEVDLAVRVLLEGQGVLHPVLVITLRVVLTGMGTTRLLTVGGSMCGLRTVDGVSQLPK